MARLLLLEEGQQDEIQDLIQVSEATSEGVSEDVCLARQLKDVYPKCRMLAIGAMAMLALVAVLHSGPVMSLLPPALQALLGRSEAIVGYAELTGKQLAQTHIYGCPLFNSRFSAMQSSHNAIAGSSYDQLDPTAQISSLVIGTSSVMDMADFVAGGIRDGISDIGVQAASDADKQIMLKELIDAEEGMLVSVNASMSLIDQKVRALPLTGPNESWAAVSVGIKVQEKLRSSAVKSSYMRWQGARDYFGEATFQNLSGAQKLTYLQSYLQTFAQYGIDLCTAMTAALSVIQLEPTLTVAEKKVPLQQLASQEHSIASLANETMAWVVQQMKALHAFPLSQQAAIEAEADSLEAKIGNGTAALDEATSAGQMLKEQMTSSPAVVQSVQVMEAAKAACSGSQFTSGSYEQKVWALHNYHEALSEAGTAMSMAAVGATTTVQMQQLTYAELQGMVHMLLTAENHTLDTVRQGFLSIRQTLEALTSSSSNQSAATKDAASTLSQQLESDVSVSTAMSAIQSARATINSSQYSAADFFGKLGYLQTGTQAAMKVADSHANAVKNMITVILAMHVTATEQQSILKSVVSAQMYKHYGVDEMLQLIQQKLNSNSF